MGGERLALDADVAHSTMRGGANPSDLSVAYPSCGTNDCHSGFAAEERDHIQRVQSSVQATYAGAIALVRYSFGGQPDAEARLGITAVSTLKAFDPTHETHPSIFGLFRQLPGLSSIR